MSDPQTPGFSVFVYSWPGQSWPECQCPSTATCKMDGANASATVTTRYGLNNWGEGEVVTVILNSYKLVIERCFVGLCLSDLVYK